MPKPKKKLFVIPDTNILYSPDIKDVISPGFELAWKKITEHGDVELCLPALTVDELTYQRFVVAVDAIEHAKKNFASIESATGIKPPSLPDEIAIRNGVANKLNQWIKHIAATVLQVPHQRIEWPSLIQDTVWRKSPFEKGKKEKGFRDRLILETVADFCTSNGGGVTAFVSGDKELGNAALQRLDTNTDFKLIESIGRLASEVELLALHLETQFVTSILSDAANTFFSLTSKETVFERCKVNQEITTKFGKNLEPRMQLSVTSPFAQWSPVGPDERVVVGETIFVSREAKNRYHWKTSVKFQRQFTPDDFSRRTALLGINDRIREIEFGVFWNCAITSDAKFSDFALDDIKPDEPRLLNIWTTATAGPSGNPIQSQPYMFDVFEPQTYVLPSGVGIPRLADNHPFVLSPPLIFEDFNPNQIIITDPSKSS